MSVLKASLVYRSNCRTARAKQRKPKRKKKIKKEKKNKQKKKKKKTSRKSKTTIHGSCSLPVNTVSRAPSHSCCLLPHHEGLDPEPGN